MQQAIVNNTHATWLQPSLWRLPIPTIRRSQCNPTINSP